MQRLKIDQAEAGMILAGDVSNERGMILCKKGMALSETILRRLKSAGVDTVSVQGPPAAGAAEPTLGEQIAELHRRFEKTAAIPLMASLREICERQLMLRYGAEGPNGAAQGDEDSDGPAAS